MLTTIVLWLLLAWFVAAAFLAYEGSNRNCCR